METLSDNLAVVNGATPTERILLGHERCSVCGEFEEQPGWSGCWISAPLREALEDWDALCYLVPGTVDSESAERALHALLVAGSELTDAERMSLGWPVCDKDGGRMCAELLELDPGREEWWDRHTPAERSRWHNSSVLFGTGDCPKPGHGRGLDIRETRLLRLMRMANQRKITLDPDQTPKGS